MVRRSSAAITNDNPPILKVIPWMWHSSERKVQRYFAVFGCGDYSVLVSVDESHAFSQSEGFLAWQDAHEARSRPDSSGVVKNKQLKRLSSALRFSMSRLFRICVN